MPQTIGNFKFLLIFVDTFSGGVEAYPNRTEKAIVVAKLILKEIIPRFGQRTVVHCRNLPEDKTGTTNSRETTCILETSI